MIAKMGKDPDEDKPGGTLEPALADVCSSSSGGNLHRDRNLVNRFAFSHDWEIGRHHGANIQIAAQLVPGFLLLFFSCVCFCAAAVAVKTTDRGLDRPTAVELGKGRRTSNLRFLPFGCSYRDLLGTNIEPSEDSGMISSIFFLPAAFSGGEL